MAIQELSMESVWFYINEEQGPSHLQKLVEDKLQSRTLSREEYKLAHSKLRLYITSNGVQGYNLYSLIDTLVDTSMFGAHYNEDNNLCITVVKTVDGKEEKLVIVDLPW